VAKALGVSPDDIFLALIPVPNENFSFGRGELQLAEGGERWGEWIHNIGRTWARRFRRKARLFNAMIQGAF
jgi:hypothetical protein